MRTIEDVIKGLDCCSKYGNGKCDEGCPYWGDHTCRDNLEHDAMLKLLMKAQEVE